MFCFSIIGSLSVCTINAYSGGFLAFAKSSETLQLYYTGDMTFTSDYKVNTKSYGLEKGKYIKRGHMIYLRNNKCVTTTGTRVYTPIATSKTKKDVYYATAHAWDSLGCNDPKTLFRYGWQYFN